MCGSCYYVEVCGGCYYVEVCGGCYYVEVCGGSGTHAVAGMQYVLICGQKVKQER